MRKKEFYSAHEIMIPSYKKFLIPILLIWFIIQVALPLRHWFIPGDVLWTEEGHRLSWRMMLRGRSGTTHYYIVDNNDPNGKKQRVNKKEYLSKKQIRSASTKPDVIWQFAQRLKEIYKSEGKDVAVFVKSKVSVNRKKRNVLIDPDIDLTSVEWNHFTTNPWILKYDGE